MEHGHVGRKLRRSVEPSGLSAARLHGGHEPLPFDAGARHTAPPEFARMEVREEIRDAAEMIGVRVRDRNGVDPEDLTGQEERRDHGRAGVEVAAWKAAGIDHDHSAPGELENTRVALPDVEEGRAEMRTRSLPHPPSCVDEQAGERDRRQHASSAPRQEHEARERRIEQRQLPDGRDRHVDRRPGRSGEPAHDGDAGTEDQTRQPEQRLRRGGSEWLDERSGEPQHDDD